ncbi:MAG: 3-alpha,7-alpha,12-alpha-trihydroxy-5-beta-cholest-24-enoyl-CoA hydratase [Rhodospirillaceae bacterium]|nr:MAG: 3-alpha,7-alpha,12-alpha-trihydroxy-5-beta-cholest-24-enoyl-CoA hydratase [Rhodospirillaceae bacterium]
MKIDLAQIQDLMRAEPQILPFSYDSKDAILYALGVGYGQDPLDERELPFVYERGLRVAPTIVTVLGGGGQVPNVFLRMGLDLSQILHGEESIEIHRPLPTSGRMVREIRLTQVFDKGRDKGAVIYTQSILRDQDNGAAIATIERSAVARADGGFGGSSAGQPPPHPIPDRAPDFEVALPTAPSQALLYRLSGDLNPLHVDPAFARKVGFPRPILHGLCTYGITCRAVLQAVADLDASRLKAHAARFSAPVFPGETIVTHIWKDGDTISFTASVRERPGTVVIRNGRSIVST